MKAILCLVLVLLAANFSSSAIARDNKTKKWEEVPEAVRKTILANGGGAGPVDREDQKIGGKVVYEAPGKDKQGKEVDLVVAEDGTLVKTKDDDAVDRKKEIAALSRKALIKIKFTHPREIDHPFLPLASVKQDILEGSEGGKKVRIERTVMPEKRKSFKIGKQTIEALVVEDREFMEGEIEEVATDYFAQSDDGTVYYLGEDVDEYRGGKLIGHAGSWLFGKDTGTPGVLLPAHPKVGDRFKSEDVSRVINEEDEVVSVSVKVTVPTGTYQDCVKVKEHLADGTTEYKYYARGVGVVKEVVDAEVVLKSHETTK